MSNLKRRKMYFNSNQLTQPDIEDCFYTFIWIQILFNTTELFCQIIRNFFHSSASFNNIGDRILHEGSTDYLHDVFDCI